MLLAIMLFGEDFLPHAKAQRKRRK